MKVYVAAPLKKIASARNVAERLRANGVQVVSNWHAVASDEGDPVDAFSREAIFTLNILDLEKSDAVLVVSPEGGRTTYVEAGYAIARDIPVHWVYGDAAASSIADSHPGCKVHKSIEAAIEELKAAS